MMFAVEWSRTAENQLAEVWSHASDRNLVTAAVQRIDEALRLNPETCGESRDWGRRILIEPPLAVTFSVDSMNRSVLVLYSWRLPAPRGRSS
jgi:plasmid stabilization system protein ParE